MPSLGSHLLRAYRVAERLGLPEIEADRGAFLLGATAPDIRVITRRDREDTHFFRLDDLADQDSVARMFRENPSLAMPSGLDAATTASYCALSASFLCTAATSSWNLTADSAFGTA